MTSSAKPVTFFCQSRSSKLIRYPRLVYHTSSIFSMPFSR
nr:MAG TPA: hypothetical protein [Caudoviricetes sp.]